MSFKTVFSGIAALMATAVMANDSIPSSAFERESIPISPL